MKPNIRPNSTALMQSLPTFLLAILAAAPAPTHADEPRPPRQMEFLNRGLVAVRKPDGGVFLSWRFLGNDPEDIAFNLYRTVDNNPPARLNREPITHASCFLDPKPDPHASNAYFVRALVNGRQLEPSEHVVVAANSPSLPYLAIPLQTPDGYTPNDASVGDLDGDGAYEVILHQAKDGRDNSQNGVTAPPILEAYTLAGKLLWRINLGRNIREGAHYTQFMVYDLDDDGRAEVVCKTADGTVDGAGSVLGDPSADYRDPTGRILRGPEFLTVFDGLTGKALATEPYLPARGRIADWGDAYGNRVDRFLACVAYLDGVRPSVVFARGYYTRTVLVAWNWRDGKLSRAWVFDSDAGPSSNRAYRGQGDHTLAVGDVDDDGKDEIVYGACCIDDDGKGLYSTGLGHGDALHLSDLDPNRPGLEIFNIHERPKHPHGAELHDARTGAILWSKPSPDVGRGVAFDIDPRHPGAEMWASGRGLEGLWNARGETISNRKPRSCNFGVWWDGDPLRELLDRNRISKWNWIDSTDTPLLTADGCSSNNSTKATPCLCADILGDWREEVIWRSTDNRELRIYSTPIPTALRLRTLMHDPQYRLSVAWQNVGYNQPTQTGFFLGDGMIPPPQPNIDARPAARRLHSRRYTPNTRVLKPSNCASASISPKISP